MSKSADPPVSLDAPNENVLREQYTGILAPSGRRILQDIVTSSVIQQRIQARRSFGFMQKVPSGYDAEHTHGWYAQVLADFKCPATNTARLISLK